MTTPGGDAESITWRGEFENGISLPAEAAAASIDELGDESVETAAELKLLQREARAAGNELAFLAAKSKLAGQQFDTDADYIKRLRRETELIRKETERHSRTVENLTKKKRALNKAFKDAAKTGFGFTKVLGVLFKVTMGVAKAVVILGVVLGATGLVAVLIKAVPWVLALVKELSSLLALSALLPTAIGSLIASVATLKMAFKGIGQALSAGFSDDFEAYTEALNKLSPAAASFVRKVVGFAPQLKSLQKTVQESFFAPLLDDIVPLLETLIPVIGDGAKRLAGGFAEIFRVIMTWARSPAGISAISSFFRTADLFARTFAGHLMPVLDGFSRVLETVEPIWARLMNNMGSGMDKFGAWLVKISDDGTLERWLDMAFVTAKMLGEIFGSLFRILNAIAGVSQGGALLTIVTLFNTIAEFLESPEGQVALLNFFQALNEIIAALAPTLPFLSQIIVLLAQALADIVIGAAPGFIELLRVIVQELNNLTAENGPDFWLKLGQGIGTFLTDIAAIMPFVSEVVERLVWLLSQPHVITALVIMITLFIAIFNIVTALVPLFMALAAIVGGGPAIAIIAGIIVAVIETIVWVVALIAAINWLMDNWEAISNFIEAWAIRIGVWIFDNLIYPFMSAYYVVRDFFSFLDKIVQMAIAYFDMAMERLEQILKNPWEALKAFVTDFFENVLPDLVNRGAEKVKTGFSNFIDFLNPFDDNRFAGGPVQMGHTYVTNELGAEKFLNTSTGAVSAIGDGSMGKWTAPATGLVIPAHLTEAFDRAIAAAKTSGHDGAELDPDLAFGRGGGDVHEDNRQYHMHATIHTKGDPGDVEAEVKRVWKKLRRDEVERRP